MIRNELTPEDVYVFDRAELCFLADATNTSRLLYMDGGVGLLHVGVDLETAGLRLDTLGYRELIESPEQPLARAFACLRNEDTQIEVQINESEEERRTYLFARDGEDAVSVSPSPLGSQFGFVIRRFSADTLEAAVLECCGLEPERKSVEMPVPRMTVTVSAARFLAIRQCAVEGDIAAAVEGLRAWAWPELLANDFAIALSDRPPAYELRHLQRLQDGRFALDEISWILTADGTGWTFTLNDEQRFAFSPTTGALLRSDVVAALRSAQ